MERRDFLKKLGITTLGVVAVGVVGKKILSDTLEGEDDGNSTIKKHSGLIQKKPIDLGYKKIVGEKNIKMINMPQNPYHSIARVAKCLRWQPITNVVEKRYGIPEGLLMAMMAQEGMGDPTQPNVGGDGGLGLIHIQAINAKRYGLKTLPIYTEKYKDYQHGNEIKKVLQKTNDISKLIDYDDRFHPIMAIDAAARFLKGCHNNNQGTDARIHALEGYSGRSYSGYAYKVIRFRGAIAATNPKIPFPPQGKYSRNVSKDMKKAYLENKRLSTRVHNLQFRLDNEIIGYDEYLAYFEESMNNYELDKYITFCSGLGITDTSDNNNTKTQQSPGGGNTLIQGEFVNTHQHNSEGFILFRYKVKKGDNPSGIAQRFNQRDQSNGGNYKKTGTLNIVNSKGIVLEKIFVGQIVYIKVKK